MSLQARLTLLEFEKSLRPRFREVGLVGEIPLADDDASEIQSAIRELLKADGPESSASFLREKALCTLACFLVWKGVQEYSEGTYWTEVHRAVGLPKNARWQGEWGEIFEEVIQHFQLADFRDIGGLRFVTPILLHGGIPTSCLPDFFDHVIGPAVQDSLGYSDNVRDFIDDFLASSRVQITNKPVRRFLEKGGKIADDFVQRCIDLAFQADSVEPSSSGEEFGLPQYVVEQFFAWWKESAASQPQTFRRTDLPRYRAPQIFLSINQGGISISFSFPAQRIPRNILMDTHGLRLEVRQDGGGVTYLLDGNRTGEMIETLPYNGTLSLKEKYEFILFAGTKQLRTWSFPGLSTEQCWLIFYGPSKKLLPGRVITERDIWIVFPASWTIDPTPSVRVLEEAAFTREFQAKRLVIEGHPPDMCFTDGDGKSASVPVKWRDIPTLQPASPEIWPRLSSEDADREFTVYCGSPPRLFIPRSLLDRAFLTIRPIGHSYPTGRKKIRLKALSTTSEQDEDLTLALDDPALLGPTPCGRFILQVRGRLGKDTTFRLCLLPEIQFDFPRSALLPDPETDSETVSFSLAHSYLEEIDVEPPAEQSYDGDGSQVEVPSDSRHVRLTLHLSAGEARAEVPLTVPVSRLRWAVSGLDESEALTWCITPVTITLQDLEDAQEVRLLVRGDFGQPVECVLSLEGADQSESFWVRNGNGRVHLSPFLDSLRENGRSRNEFSLTFSLPDENRPRRLCPVLVDTTWLVEGLEIIPDFTPDEGERRLLFRWHDSGNVKNRAFRLWSLDRRGKEPVEVIRVEDGCSEVEFHTTLAKFPHGLYQMELTILDEWAEPSSTALPSPNVDMVFYLDVREDEIILLRHSEVLARLYNRLTDTETNVRQQAAQALEYLGVDAVPWLIEQITDGDTAVRQHATQTLVEMGYPKADLLIDTLADKDESLRQQVIHILEQLGVDLVPRMVERLTDEDTAVRQHAARALGILASPRVVGPLIRCLTDKDWNVRNHAVHALGKVGRPAVTPLVDTLADKDEGVRRHTIDALIKILDKVDRPAIAPLINALTHSNENVRHHAAHVLVKSGVGIVPQLVERLTAEDTAVRQHAVRALRVLTDASVISRLPQEVRQEAKQALAEQDRIVLAAKKKRARRRRKRTDS